MHLIAKNTTEGQKKDHISNIEKEDGTMTENDQDKVELLK